MCEIEDQLRDFLEMARRDISDLTPAERDELEVTLPGDFWLEESE